MSRLRSYVLKFQIITFFITCAFDVPVAREGTMLAGCLMENRGRFFRSNGYLMENQKGISCRVNITEFQWSIRLRPPARRSSASVTYFLYYLPNSMSFYLHSSERFAIFANREDITSARTPLRLCIPSGVKDLTST